MRRMLNPLAIIYCVATCSAFGATAIRSSYTAGSTALSIDGVFSGWVTHVEGGDPRARVVMETASSGALTKKHLGSVTYAPITLDVDVPPSQPLLDWIGDLCANRKTRKTVTLTDYDFNHQPIGLPLQAMSAALTEVRLPALDAASKDSGHLTLVITPESTRDGGAAAAPPATAGIVKKGTLGNFKFHVGTLTTTHVSKVDALTIKQDVNALPLGETRSSAGATLAPEFSNVLVTLSLADSAGWNAWREDFIVKGICDDASEKSGSLEMLAQDNSTLLLTVQFSHVGILRATPLATNAGQETVGKLQVELYCEGMSIGTTATASPKDPGKSTPPASETSSGKKGSTAETATPTDVKGSTKSAAANSADLGTRDPADFPRPDGTVRKNFSAFRSKLSSQEMTVYTATGTLESIEQFYDKNLKEAGWESTTRLENNNGVGNTHQIISNWKNGLRAASITLTETKTGPEISVNVTTTIPQ